MAYKNNTALITSSLIYLNQSTPIQYLRLFTCTLCGRAAHMTFTNCMKLRHCMQTCMP